MKQTDPRTPPALSNATPRPPCHCPVVSEGPEYRLQIIPECPRHGTKPAVAEPAEARAAAPHFDAFVSEWLREHNFGESVLAGQVFDKDGNPFFLVHIMRVIIENHAADHQRQLDALNAIVGVNASNEKGILAIGEKLIELQRQLDEARREREALLSELTAELGLTKSYADRFELQKKISKKLLERFTEEKQRAESAEAANQELRTLLQAVEDDCRYYTAKGDHNFVSDGVRDKVRAAPGATPSTVKRRASNARSRD